MPGLYKTPNVYVEEISTLPPSMAPVATAIPAFIGYTEKPGENIGDEIVPVRINSMLDYKQLFGGAAPTDFTVTLRNDSEIDSTWAVDQIGIDEGKSSAKVPVTPKFLLYYTLQLFFNNGGGSCYIASVGNYDEDLAKERFEAGLEAISKEDEPTLLLLTDAVNLANRDYYGLCIKALEQCEATQDRFAIFDLPSSENTIADFRNHIGSTALKYGAAYYPYVKTNLSYHYTDASVSVGPIGKVHLGPNDALLVTYTGLASDKPKAKIIEEPDSSFQESLVVSRDNSRESGLQVTIEDGVLTIQIPQEGAEVREIVKKAAALGKYRVEAGAYISPDTRIPAPNGEDNATDFSFSPWLLCNKLLDRKGNETELYNTIKAQIDGMKVTMPPSGAIAGVYAQTDRDRGVWKAPANVSLASVIAPTVKITNEEQQTLNVDISAGKSINAIRSFTGKGTMVWGARTLAGNDNEWRYISVRRLFCVIEESIQKATSFVVFESNNAVTWLKVRTLIETYLESLWRQGALAGSSQKEAFFVAVGLGQTMTPKDIADGRILIDIGISAVRPAEFIVLRFSHQIQQA